MEDFGNIVYVVAAIAWFAWNTYKKSQQGAEKQPQSASKPKRQVQTYDEQPSRSLEDIIMEQLEGRKAPEPKPIPVARSNNQDKFLNTDLTHSHLSERYKMSSGEMKSHRVQRQVQKLEVVETHEENLMDRLMPNGFDLRQAVVLNAILERPYN